jgi:hypothetical protein
MKFTTKLLSFVALCASAPISHADSSHTYACAAARQGNVPVTVTIDSILNKSKPVTNVSGIELKPYETTAAVYKQGVLQKRSKVLESTGFPDLMDVSAEFKFESADESLKFPTHQLISEDVPKAWGKRAFTEHKKNRFDISLNGMAYHCKYLKEGQPSAELVATVNPPANIDDSAAFALEHQVQSGNGPRSETPPNPPLHDDSQFMGPGASSN